MKKIYAPWRSQYVRAQDGTKSPTASKKECIFCTHLAENADAENFILKRLNHCFIVMNTYPYNSGHVMVLPNAHIGELAELDSGTRNEMFAATSQAIETIKNVIAPAGFNIGMNLGRAAGAGIPSHLHMHIVPRWDGDTNFMPIIGETKPVSFDLSELYLKLKPKFEKINSQKIS